MKSDEMFIHVHSAVENCWRTELWQCLALIFFPRRVAGPAMASSEACPGWGRDVFKGCTTGRGGDRAR